MKRVLLVVLLLALVVPLYAVGQATLDTILARGKLIVGVNAVLPGFGALDAATGEFDGFDVDYGRAIAAAIGVDVEFIPLTAGERLTALQMGQIDVLLRNTTWTSPAIPKNWDWTFAQLRSTTAKGSLSERPMESAQLKTWMESRSV